MNCAQTDGYLDALMDDALTESDHAALETHCAGCAACAEKLRATEMMKRLLAETAPEIDVPLEAQAAWRRAIKTEARGKHRRRWLPALAGGIAAALVVAMGNFFIVRDSRNDLMAAVQESVAGESVAVVEADGQAFESIDAAVSRAVPMVERRIAVEDLDRACAYMADLVSEYEGEFEEQRYDADGVACADLYVDLPAENAGDFLVAAAHYDIGDAADAAFEAEAGDERVSILLTMEAKNL